MENVFKINFISRPFNQLIWANARLREFLPVITHFYPTFNHNITTQNVQHTIRLCYLYLTWGAERSVCSIVFQLQWLWEVLAKCKVLHWYQWKQILRADCNREWSNLRGDTSLNTLTNSWELLQPSRTTKQEVDPLREHSWISHQSNLGSSWLLASIWSRVRFQPWNDYLLRHMTC